MAGYYCTLVHGTCRGKMCDFWARTKIKKSTVEDLITGFRNSISECDEGVPLNQAIEQYWSDLGIKSISVLCKEEPAVCEKMKEVERRITS
ncbi:MAG: hypothetical protein ACW98Y_03635 [Candidatus Thorarchaeota archaeon]